MFSIGKNCKIHSSVEINVIDGYLGDGSVLNSGVKIEGRLVEIGREAFLDSGATIGGGSCFSDTAFLKTKDWLHMGSNSHINTAMGVTVGNSVGIGVNTKIFTHGAYLDSFNMGGPTQWAPVVIGDNVWLPNAWVNPGVTIGNNVVVAAMSLINNDIPSGSLVGGVPAKILNSKYLPKVLSVEEKKVLIETIKTQCFSRGDLNPNAQINYIDNKITIIENGKITDFDLINLTIVGDVSQASVAVKDQLRRNGIRFRYSQDNNSWVAWA